MIRSGTTCYNDMYFAIDEAAATSSAIGIRAAGDEPDGQRRNERGRVGNDEHTRFLFHSKPPLPD